MFLKMGSDVTRCSCHKKLCYACPKMLAFGLKVLKKTNFSPNASISHLLFVYLHHNKKTTDYGEIDRKGA